MRGIAQQTKQNILTVQHFSFVVFPNFHISNFKKVLSQIAFGILTQFASHVASIHCPKKKMKKNIRSHMHPAHQVNTGTHSTTLRKHQQSGRAVIPKRSRCPNDHFSFISFIMISHWSSLQFSLNRSGHAVQQVGPRPKRKPVSREFVFCERHPPKARRVHYKGCGQEGGRDGGEPSMGSNKKTTQKRK